MSANFKINITYGKLVPVVIVIAFFQACYFLFRKRGTRQWKDTLFVFRYHRRQFESGLSIQDYHVSIPRPVLIMFAGDLDPERGIEAASATIHSPEQARPAAPHSGNLELENMSPL